MELLGILSLVIGGGFDTTTALHSPCAEWLSKTLTSERDSVPTWTS